MTTETEHNQLDEASLTERAYRAIAGAITSMELKPGEALTQDRLARWLQISRTPVREALKRLEQEAVIQSVPGRGLVVKELTLRDVAEMLEMLRLLDGHAAELAAQRRTDAQAAELVNIARDLLVCAERHDVAAWSVTDKPYHDILLSASGNTLLAEQIRDLRRRLHRITINSGTRTDRLLACTHEHIAVAEAVQRGDAVAAGAAMRHHIDEMTVSALRLVREVIIPVRGERF